MPAVFKKLVGHVDNSSYPIVTVDRSGAGAGPVYKLLGRKDLGVVEFPAIGTPLLDGDISFRQHSGGLTQALNRPVFLAYATQYFSNGSK